MIPTIRIHRSGMLIYSADGVNGETLLKRIIAAGVFFDAPCGGQGKCGKCRVSMQPDGEQVLACRTTVDGDMDVYLPELQDMTIAGAGGVSGATGAVGAVGVSGATGAVGAVGVSSVDISGAADAAGAGDAGGAAQKKLGVAIDIGTTTVVAHLTDIATGTRIATASGVNAQRPYGADVISRIQYCSDNGHETLTQLIRYQLATLIRSTCATSGANTGDIVYVSIAANTIMEHLAAGYSPVSMGVVPFTTVSLFGGEMPAWEGLPVAEGAKIYFAPAISAYVGGDITAGMLAASLEDNMGPAVYLDIGTNGEIAMKTGDTYYCCATAAGPAFEGAEITMGMAAVTGAISHVHWDEGLHFSVIGDTLPTGLCGSGLLDALAVLLETGAVDESGRLLGADEIDHDIAAHIGEIDGKNVFWLACFDPGVYMTAADIRKLQLAKAAIAAGIQTLLVHSGITGDQVKSFVLAGGFGSYMDQFSAARIGLFPKSFLPVSQTLGNTAGEGAAIALCSESARATLSDIRKRCEYIELSSSPVFNEQFVEQMTFED